MGEDGYGALLRRAHSGACSFRCPPGQDDEAALKAACDALGKLRERYNAQKKAMDAAKRPAGTQTE